VAAQISAAARAQNANIALGLCGAGSGRTFGKVGLQVLEKTFVTMAATVVSSTGDVNEHTAQLQGDHGCMGAPRTEDILLMARCLVWGIDFG